MSSRDVSRKRRWQRAGGDYDYEEITVEETWKKVVKESFVKDDQKGHSTRSDTRHLHSTPRRRSTRHGASPKKKIDKAVSNPCRSLKESICSDSDTDSCSSDICSDTSCIEIDDSGDVPDGETRRCRRGRCSENLNQVPPHSNDYTGRLPDRGHVSAPPNLDATWTMTSHERSTGHEYSSRPHGSSAKFRNEMNEECWCSCSCSESGSECEPRCESPRRCFWCFDKDYN